MKKVVSVMLAVMMLFSLTACAGGSKEESGEKETDGGDKIRVGFSQMDNNGAWRVVETEDMKAVAEERGYELVYADAQSQTSKDVYKRQMSTTIRPPPKATPMLRPW